MSEPPRSWDKESRVPEGYSNRVIVLGALLTLAAVVLIEIIFSRLLGIPTPVAAIAAVAYAAYAGGLAAGLVSAGIVSAYSIYFYRAPGAILAYTQDDALRMLMLVLTAFAIAVMVGLLRSAETWGREELRRSEQRFRSLVQNSSEIISILGADGSVLYESPAVARVLGYKPEETLRTQGFEYVHPEDLSRVAAEFRRSLESRGAGSPIEMRVRHADGSWRYVETTLTNLLDDPSVQGIVVNMRDVTERKQAEMDVSRQNEYLAALYETTLGLLNRLEPAELLEDILARSGALLGAPHGHIYFAAPELGKIQVRLTEGTFTRYDGDSIRPGEGLTGKILQTGEPLTVIDYDSWSGRSTEFERGVMRAAAGVPLKSGGVVLGVLALAYVEEARTFGENEMQVLDRFAQLASIALDNSRLYASAQRELAERRRAEEALRESEERFQLAVRGTSDGLWDWDLETNKVYLSPRWKQMLGYEDHEMPNDLEEWRKRVHPDDLARCLATIDAYVSGEIATYELEHRLQHKDGTYRWILTRGALARDGNGKPVRFAGSHTDITDRKLAEEELRRSEANLAEAQRIAHLGSWEWDLPENTERWSDEVYRIFGYVPRQVAPTYEIFLASVHPDDRDRVRAAVDAALQNEKPYSIDHRIILPDGTERIVHEQAEVMFDDEGEPLRMVGTVHDVTERRRAEEQVKRALAVRNQFLSVASHELKTPVTLMKGYAQILEKRARQQGDSAALKPLVTINRQADRMGRLINDLLDVSRIESGRVKFDMHPFELGGAVEEVMHDVADSSPGFHLRMNKREGEAWVRGDRMRTQQVVTNLLTNAVKYSHERREIEVCLECRDGRALVTVTDYGIGIPESQQAEVFELYFRGANASTDNYGGLGLGLFISRSIIERHGGEIGVRSQEGRGSAFHFSLPLLETAPLS